MQIYANINMHKYAKICKMEICIIMQLYAGICTVYIICINMQIYALRKICKNMQLKICINMHKICNKYAVPHNYASYEKICKNMQKMQLYARYANMIFICKICTPHLADGGGRVAVVREIHQVQKARGNKDHMLAAEELSTDGPTLPLATTSKTRSSSTSTSGNVQRHGRSS